MLMSNEPLYRKLPNYASVGRLIRSARVSAGLPLSMSADDELGSFDDFRKMMKSSSIKQSIARSNIRTNTMTQRKRLSKSFKRGPDRIKLRFNEIIWTAMDLQDYLSGGTSKSFIGHLPKYTVGMLGLYAMNMRFLDMVYEKYGSIDEISLHELMMHVNNVQNIVCVERRGPTARSTEGRLRYKPGVIAKKIGPKRLIFTRNKGSGEYVVFEDIPALMCGIVTYDLRGRTDASIEALLHSDGIDADEYRLEVIKACVSLHNSLTISSVIGDTMFYINDNTIERVIYKGAHPAVRLLDKRTVEAMKLNYCPRIVIHNVEYDLSEPRLEYEVTIDFTPLLRMYRNDPDMNNAIEGFFVSLFKLSGIESERIAMSPSTSDLTSTPLPDMTKEQLSSYFSLLKAEYEEVVRYIDDIRRIEDRLGYGYHDKLYALMVVENSDILDVLVDYYFNFTNRWSYISLIPEYITVLNGIVEYTNAISEIRQTLTVLQHDRDKIQSRLTSKGIRANERVKLTNDLADGMRKLEVYNSELYRLTKERDYLVRRKHELEGYDPIRRLKFDDEGNKIIRERADEVQVDETTIAQEAANRLFKYVK